MVCASPLMLALRVTFTPTCTLHAYSYLKELICVHANLNPLYISINRLIPVPV